MAQSKEFVDASHALNDLSHALALLESENASLRGAVDGLCNENAKLRELAKGLSWCSEERYLGHQESECPLYDERTDGKCRAEALVKELGIEVDE